jgi:hypothetical protein
MQSTLSLEPRGPGRPRGAQQTHYLWVYLRRDYLKLTQGLLCTPRGQLNYNGLSVDCTLLAGIKCKDRRWGGGRGMWMKPGSFCTVTIHTICSHYMYSCTICTHSGLLVSMCMYPFCLTCLKVARGTACVVAPHPV